MTEEGKLPDYVDCNFRNGKITHCEYLIHQACPGTCAYARDVHGKGNKVEQLNIGAMSEETAKGLPKIIKEK